MAYHIPGKNRDNGAEWGTVHSGTASATAQLYKYKVQNADYKSNMPCKKVYNTSKEPRLGAYLYEKRLEHTCTVRTSLLYKSTHAHSN